jgi:hypothetical protein
MFHVSLYIKPRQVKWDQVRKNGGKQIIPITTCTFKQFQKYTTTRIIKYRFIWGIINKQSVPNMGVGKFWKENIKVLVENWFLKMMGEKTIIFLAQLLSKNSWWIQRNIYFLFNFVQIFVDVITSCNKPNINFELR